MADGYWRYNEARQQAVPQAPLKRPRPGYDIPGGHEMPSYFSREEERVGYGRISDTENIGASYDRYLGSGQIASFGGGGASRAMVGEMIGRPADDFRTGRPVDDFRSGRPSDDFRTGRPADDFRTGRPADDFRTTAVRGYDPMAGRTQSGGIAGGKQEMSLPSDASNTLFVEGLPSNCSRREVSHIFRPFVGFKEVRLVSKEARQSGGDPLVLCFVDFTSPAQAATAMDALQGYSFDEHDRNSEKLRLQFARFPGPRSGGRPRGGKR